MKPLMSLIFVLILALVFPVLHAQILSEPQSQIARLTLQQAVALAPAATAVTSVDIVHDSSATGKAVIDIVATNPGAVFSLLTPAGVTVTSANAASLGYTFDTYTVGAQDVSMLTVPLLSEGTHMVMHFPQGQASRTYQVRADTTAVASQTGLYVTYYSPSRVRAGLTTGGALYRTGQTVAFSALVFDGNTPIPGATITAEIARVVALAGQASIGAYSLQSSAAAGTGRTRYVYKASVTNSGPAAQMVVGIARSVSTDLSVIDARLMFGNAGAGATVVSQDTFTIEMPTGVSFSPSMLQWEIGADGALTSVTLADSGPGDTQPNDGVYNGSFVPPGAGEYTVVARVAGSAGGVAFLQHAITNFSVESPTATITSFQDSLADEDGNTLADSLNLMAKVSVQTPGEYTLRVNLQDSNQKVVQGVASGSLTAGTNTMIIRIPAKIVVGMLTANGPWTIRYATLTLKSTGKEVVADQKINAGTTGAHLLSAFDRGPLYFTGTNNAAVGVDTNGVSGFETLRIEFGVYTAEAMHCAWSARLRNAQGSTVEEAGGGTQLIAGNNVASVTLSGPRIRRSNLNGPYMVDVSGYCRSGTLRQAGLFQTQALQATQFENTPPSFTVAVRSSALSVQQNKRGVYILDVTALGGFRGQVTFAISGVPAATTASFQPNPVFNEGPTYLAVRPGGTAASGIYSMAVTATGPQSSATVPITLTIPGTAATPVFSPAGGTYSSTQTVTISSSTPGTAIRYTTDGSTPTATTGLIYTAPIAVSATTTVRAIAYGAGLTSSSMASATYTVQP